jgi:hypothetical protein
MTPFRQRLMDELTLRGYAARIIDSYVAVVARLARHYRLLSPPCGGGSTI